MRSIEQLLNAKNVNELMFPRPKKTDHRADYALTSVCRVAVVDCLSAFMISLSLSHQRKAYRISGLVGVE